MNEYVRYRNWWREWTYDQYYYEYYHEIAFDVAFAEHINSMTLYELMETLEGFGEEDNDEYAAGSKTEKLMLETFDDV